MRRFSIDLNQHNETGIEFGPQMDPSIFNGGVSSQLSSTLSRSEQRALRQKTEGVWLNAYTDPVAGLRAMSPCVRLADTNSDGEYRLLVADLDRKLKVFKGTLCLSTALSFSSLL